MGLEIRVVGLRIRGMRLCISSKIGIILAVFSRVARRIPFFISESFKGGRLV